jgi:glycosyltransferase involved in cell wall biosynthesis
MMANVDIIIPTYNRAAVLAETLKSVQDQTLTTWRCFIAEDGETAATREAIAPFLQDSRFAYLPGPHAGTPAAPRNRAIRAGSAPFIAFLDDDDLWLPEKLAEQVRFMDEHPQCLLAGANAYTWDGQTAADNGRELYFKDMHTGQLAFEKLAADNKIINSTAVVRRPVLAESGLLNETPGLASCEDFELWLRIGALGELWLMEQPLAIYRNAPQASIRKEITLADHHRRLALVYKTAVRGSSPLARPVNKQRAYLCRNLADYYSYLADPFLGWRWLYFQLAAEVRNVLLKLR